MTTDIFHPGHPLEELSAAIQELGAKAQAAEALEAHGGEPRRGGG
jgi:hypothetical protein